MRIIIITQDDPFYLGKNLNYLFSILPDDIDVVACVVASASPFGKRESFFKKAKKTYDIFGLKFFLYYSLKLLRSKIDSRTRVINVLNKHNIPLIKLNSSINSKNSVDKIKAYEPDLLLSILGNQIFKLPIINLAPKGCLNLHTALLPKYRGLMPTFWVMKNNEKTTGVSVFYVDEGVDSGPIIVQKKVQIEDRTQEELIKFTKKIGMEAIAEAIDLIKNNAVEIIENNAKEKTYFSFPTKEDVRQFKRIGKKFF